MLRVRTCENKFSSRVNESAAGCFNYAQLCVCEIITPEIGIKWISLGSYANLFRERVCESGGGWRAAELILASTRRTRINYFRAGAAALISRLIRLLSIFALLMQHTHRRTPPQQPGGEANGGRRHIWPIKNITTGAHFSTLLPRRALAAEFMLLKIQTLSPIHHAIRLSHTHTHIPTLCFYLGIARNDVDRAKSNFSTGKSTKAGTQRLIGGVGGPESASAALFHQSHPLFALFHLKAHHEMAIYRFAQCARLKSTLCEKQPGTHSHWGPALPHSLTHSALSAVVQFWRSRRTIDARAYVRVFVLSLFRPCTYLRTPMCVCSIAGNERRRSK